MQPTSWVGGALGPVIDYKALVIYQAAYGIYV
jgi:hypothetical protein